MPDTNEDLEEAWVDDSVVSNHRAPKHHLGMARVALFAIVCVGLGLYALTGELVDWDVGNQARATASSTITLASPNALRSVASMTSPQFTATPRFAYMFYITRDIYACAVLHLMRTLLHTVGMDSARIDLVVLHSPSVSGAMLQRIQEQLTVRLIPVEPLFADAVEPTWHESLTKLLIFREWGYDRVVYMDADSVPMQNLDHLFELPSAPLNAPIAYWLPQPFFSSILMVLEPSNTRFDAMMAWARAQGAAAGFDMDIVNSFFKDTVQYMPGDYTVLNSDLRAPPDAPNKLYKTTTELKKHAKLVHFSCKPDGSYGKPWTAANRDLSFAAKQGFDPLFAAMYEDFWTMQDQLCRSN